MARTSSSPPSILICSGDRPAGMITMGTRTSASYPIMLLVIALERIFGLTHTQQGTRFRLPTFRSFLPLNCFYIKSFFSPTFCHECDIKLNRTRNYNIACLSSLVWFNITFQLLLFTAVGTACQLMII
jgi:hypothetical protein